MLMRAMGFLYPQEIAQFVKQRRWRFLPRKEYFYMIRMLRYFSCLVSVVVLRILLERVESIKYTVLATAVTPLDLGHQYPGRVYIPILSVQPPVLLHVLSSFDVLTQLLFVSFLVHLICIWCTSWGIPSVVSTDNLACLRTILKNGVSFVVAPSDVLWAS